MYTVKVINGSYRIQLPLDGDLLPQCFTDRDAVDFMCSMLNDAFQLGRSWEPKLEVSQTFNNALNAVSLASNPVVVNRYRLGVNDDKPMFQGVVEVVGSMHQPCEKDAGQEY